MHPILRSTFALFLAITLVAPSVYGGIQIPHTNAAMLGVGAPTTADLAGVGVSVATCNLGGWMQNFLSGAMPWLFPPVVAVNTDADKANNLATAGVVVPPAGAPTPLLVEAQANTGLAASLTSHVPTSDPFLQQQNYQLSQQLAMIQRGTQSTSESAGTTAVNSGSITWKDCVLDPLENMFKEMLVRAITDSIIDWIRGGFEGTPSFLEDPEEFFRDLGTQVVSQYLFERGLDQLLCEPFRVQVILNVATNYSRSNHAQGGRLSCSLDEIFPGVDASIDVNGNGSIDENERYLDSNSSYREMVEDGNLDYPGGGFPGFAGLLDDSNNEIGAEHEVQSEAARKVASKQAKMGATLSMGEGWFPQYCEPDAGGDGKKRICTPGEAVAEQVNEVLGGQLKSLELADEFAEIVNALISVLLEKLLANGNSLLQEAGW